MPQSRLFPSFPEAVQSNELFTSKKTDEYLLSAIARARLIKSAWEIDQIRTANAISSRAHESVMRVLAAGVKAKYQKPKWQGRALVPGEWTIESEPDAEAIFVASCLREGFFLISSDVSISR
jgi:Xaa-Pro dipeptidase